MEKLRNGFLTNGYFSLGDDVKTNTNSFFENSNELAKFKDKILDKYDDHLSIYYRGTIYRIFRNFKRVNLSEHVRSAKEFNTFLEYKGENC